jgi:Protein of unknown function with HXXEE motif
MASLDPATRRSGARLEPAFLALVLTQVAHSCEEYWGRLYDVFPPARFLSGLVSNDRQQGFVIINVALAAFGLWCFFWPVRRHWSSATPLAWAWVAIELANGIGHPLWSLRVGAYTPGLATAPLLLALALYLAQQLLRQSSRSPAS